MTTRTLKRCSCHPKDAYDSCVACPKCRHWSYDPWAGSCERRRCAYAGPLPLRQATLGLVG